MHTTPVSLLEKLQHPSQEKTRQLAWERFVQLFAPLMLLWARRLGAQDADAADLVQDVFAVLVRKLPEFRYDPGKSFRSWLRTVLVNRFRNWKVSAPVRREIAGADHSDLLDADSVEVLAEEEYRHFLVARALEIMKADFQPHTWQACWNFVVLGQPAAQVAAELGISVNAVYLAKARILPRLRDELAGFVD